jgi:hypothetical protein
VTSIPKYRDPLAQIIPLSITSLIRTPHGEVDFFSRESLDPQTSRKIARRLRAFERLLEGHCLEVTGVQLRDDLGTPSLLVLRSDWRETR